MSNSLLEIDDPESSADKKVNKGPLAEKQPFSLFRQAPRNCELDKSQRLASFYLKEPADAYTDDDVQTAEKVPAHEGEPFENSGSKKEEANNDCSDGHESSVSAPVSELYKTCIAASPDMVMPLAELQNQAMLQYQKCYGGGKAATNITASEITETVFENIGGGADSKMRNALSPMIKIEPVEDQIDGTDEDVCNVTQSLVFQQNLNAIEEEPWSQSNHVNTPKFSSQIKISSVAKPSEAVGGALVVPLTANDKTKIIGIEDPPQ